MLAPRKTLWSTPPEVINVAINALQIKSDDIVFDIGAGDGRFLTTCAKMTGAACTGIEINPERVEEALQAIKKEGLDDRCAMITGNALEQDYSTATVFYLYLIPRGLRIILPVLKALGKRLRVITYMSPFPESETPVETFQVTSAKHPDAQWPLFLYDIEPDKKQDEAEVVEGEDVTVVVDAKIQTEGEEEEQQVKTVELNSLSLMSVTTETETETNMRDKKGETTTVFNIP